MSWTDTITPEDVVRLVRQTPMQRLRNSSEHNSKAESLIAEIVSEYEWFLEMASKTEQEAADWIGHRDTRNAAFDRARKFGNMVHLLVVAATGDTDKLRYLIV